MAYLYYGRLPCFECASCEPRGCSRLAGDAWITKAKLEVAGIGNNNDNIKNNFVKGARANTPAQSDKAEAVASAEKEVVVSSCSGCFQSIRIKIPLADGNPDSRVYAYEVVVAGDEGTPKLRKAVYAAGIYAEFPATKIPKTQQRGFMVQCKCLIDDTAPVRGKKSESTWRSTYRSERAKRLEPSPERRGRAVLRP